MKRTVPIKLPADDSLVKTIQLFTQIANEVSKQVWELKTPIRNFVTLYKHCYHNLRTKYPHVNSRFIEYILRIVAGCYSPKKFRKLEEAVVFKRDFALLDKRLFTIKDGHITLWTIDGRKEFPFVLPKVGRFLELWKRKEDVDSITLKVRNGEVIGFLCLTIPESEPKDAKHFVGIDIGASYPLIAVRDDGAIFCPDYSTFHRKRQYFLELRRQLQRKLTEKRLAKKDAKSVIRALRRLSGRQRNFTKQFLRWVVCRLFDWAGDAIIIMENLHLPQGKKVKNAKALNRTLSLLPAGIIKQAIVNKAAELGLQVIFVPPAGTSQTCPRCQNKGKRPNRDLFVCPYCGYEEHADIVGARNILRKGLERFSQSGAETGDKPVGLCQPHESLPADEAGGGNPTIVPLREL